MLASFNSHDGHELCDVYETDHNELLLLRQQPRPRQTKMMMAQSESAQGHTEFEGGDF